MVSPRATSPQFYPSLRVRGTESRTCPPPLSHRNGSTKCGYSCSYLDATTQSVSFGDDIECAHRGIALVSRPDRGLVD